MQPRPIAETIGPPRPIFRCFVLVPQCEDDEIRASMHATFVVENLLRGAAHRPYRRALGDQDDEDARESDGSVRCADGIRGDWPDHSIERRDTRFWLRALGA
jgi:hypothetical protein